jgi:hypothetical protein
MDSKSDWRDLEIEPDLPDHLPDDVDRDDL